MNCTNKRYHVEFKDGHKGPEIGNLFGFLKDPFSSKNEYIDKLIAKGDYIGFTVSYSKGPWPMNAMVISSVLHHALIVSVKVKSFKKHPNGSKNTKKSYSQNQPIINT